MRELRLSDRVGALVEGESQERGAVFLPGGLGSCEWPPLRFTALLLVRLGWKAMLLHWQAVRTPEWVCEQATAALAELDVERPLLVGKSLGTYAAEVAADRRLPGIWFTPLLHQERVVEALGRAQAPALLVGGTRDEYYDASLAERLPVESLTVVGADHGLDLADPWETIDLQRRILERVDAFVRALP